MASVKKHLQNLHTDEISKISTTEQLGELWEVLKTEAQQNIDSHHRKEASQKKKEVQAVDLKNEWKEGINKPAQNLVQRELIKNPENPQPNSMMTYYNQLQPDVFRMPYANPFLYSQQNYDFLYMLHTQAASQNAARQNSYWVQNLPETIPKQPQPFEPIISRPINYAPDNNSHIQSHNSLFKVLPNSINADGEILKRANALSTTFSIPLPKGEHAHFHSEFCGHCTIFHNDHIDYVHNAELHHVTPTGIYLL